MNSVSNQTDCYYIKVAQISSKVNPNDTTYIYKIEKNKDYDFCNKLLKNLSQSNIDRMQVQDQKIKNFLKNAFNSFNYLDYSVLAIKNNNPFGLLSIQSNNFSKEAHLQYLLTWKTNELIKIKNGGRNLINFALNKYKDKDNINLTPAFNSELFYYKFGFDYENEYERDQMYIDSNEIKKQIEKLAKNFLYKEIKNEKSEDLSKFVTVI